MNTDLRGWRIALVADALLNPGARTPLPDVLTLLEASRYGALQLPPASGSHHRLLVVTADQIAEYSNHGYAIVAVGLKGKTESGLHWRRLSSLLRQRKCALPPRHVIHPKTDAGEEARKLAAFLARQEPPGESAPAGRG